MKLRHFLFFALIAASFTQINAQVLSVNTTDSHLRRDKSEGIDIFLVDTEDYLDWTFFINAEEETLFVDFETLNGRAQSIQVINNDAISFHENLTKLPSNTIYELSLNDYGAGFYTILIETSNEIIAKEFIVE